ncbi:TonB-dependent receptor plug domain-containing protein [Algoriphagus winogradskyi]|uniref:Iron complex outermembrane recepter protein n=1 Tax=Algoriphagus winogradskyi TaxID=237017 RepID=A0ABY1NH40_9BACT|nr:TonB-dependent receptor [Algoriphagus winogradskyi]SMP09661.1 iron complex outermembrane recepter protein [Algoriphagus winogradskyi]
MQKLVLLVSSLAFCLSVNAQTDTTTQELGEVLIQENRIQLPFSKQSRNISLVSKRQIETTPARSLAEVLSFVPGVDVRQRGVTGVQSDISIRGGSFEQTLMLLNGIKLSDPQTGHHMMNIPVPLVNIDRVEVLKGPASRVFGQNAYAGAINVITELSDKRYARVQGYAGDFGMKGINFAGSLPIGSYKQNLAISYDDSNGHWYNSDYQVSNIFYEGGANLNEKNELKGMIAYTDRSFGANGFYSSSFPDQWESVQTTLASLSHTLTLNNFYLNTRGYFRKNQDEYVLKRNEPSFYQNFHTTDVYALEANGNFETKLGTTGFGVETRKETIESTNLGNRDRVLTGIFLEQMVTFGSKVDLRAGVYSNYYSEYGWKHFPGAELGFQAATDFRLYSGYGISYRIPTYNDLYYVGPTNIGNDQLVPEQAQNFEIGAKWSKSGIFAELVYFNRSTDNLIEWTRPDADTPWQPQNFSQVKFNGIEASLNYRISPNGKTLHIKEFNLSYNYLDADLINQPGIETRYALTALKNQLIGGILIGIGQKLEWNTKMRNVERMNQDPYFLLDMRADYNRTGKIGFFVEASNITDTDYVEAGTVQMPGRWFRAGFMLNLE